MDLDKITVGCPLTELTYLKQMDTRTYSASTIRMVPDKGQHYYFILDKTIFHPKGGGQPSDIGILRGPDFEAKVKKAIEHNGVVAHWAKMTSGNPTLGSVECELNWAHRYVIMKRHSAAHLIDHCLSQTTGATVHTTDSWLGEESYVGYTGQPPRSTVLNSVKNLANQMICTGASITISYLSRENAATLENAPNYARLPDLEEIRTVQIGGCAPIPCGGTHVSNLSQIGQLSLLAAVRSSKQGFRLYFVIETP
ncbi:MAG: alanyl-tRNA editing protein [Candidatus Bathyarchaeia archaeon]